MMIDCWSLPIRPPFVIKQNSMETTEISKNNAAFWDELCGSNLAKSLGITDASIESLARFDDWYFNFYPYLFQHIPFSTMNGKKVLEIGLGYGTVSQHLAESGADYTGLDIAQGPVSMVNQRLNQNHLPGSAIQGSILDPQLPVSTFDYVIAIGCLHHTGNLKLAIQQCHRLLKPGGQLVFMVYYAYSYRRFRMTPLLTIKNLVKEAFGYRGVVGNASNRQRAAYDASSKGGGAPHTDWISERSLKKYCEDFASFEATTENIDQETPFRSTPRQELLKTKWPSIIGLDIYATATK
jgi:2-polyprenyl-3-methyl-5-hydroxy-6-metoxy-1,4-benzoquinol methylase